MVDEKIDDQKQYGFKHMVQCRCMLPQFKQHPDPPLHQFAVFSVMVNNDVIPKFVQCPNCGLVHKVTDINKSEIKHGRENMSAIMTIDDVRRSLPDELVDLLSQHELSIAVWEQVKFIIDNERWGSFIVLASDEEDGVRQGKLLKILGKTLYNIETFIRDEIMELK